MHDQLTLQEAPDAQAVHADRTLLRELLRQRHLKYETFSAEYEKAAAQVAADGVAPSRAQYYRWLSGQLKGGMPYLDACRVLESMFPPWTAADLFGPYRPGRHVLRDGAPGVLAAGQVVSAPGLPRPYLAVSGAVLGADGRVLVIRRADDGGWALPGGLVEPGELPEAAVCGQVWEQTGYQVIPRTLAGVHTNLPLGRVCLVFRCVLEGGHPAPRLPAVGEVAWLTPDQARARMSEAAYAPITDATQPGTGPALRGHNGTSLLTCWEPAGDRPARTWGARLAATLGITRNGQ
jgi:8-oxo-dGTP pyrophosphatase MutT (NUDIX family)